MEGLRGFGVAAAVPHAVVAVVAREAEARGFASFWVNDTPGADGLAALGVAAGVTERIALGVGVIPLDRRPASTIADDVERLALPQERLLLGVGSGSDPKGLALVRDGVSGLRERLTCHVAISALGPRMCALAGEVADGVLFNWLIPSFADASGRIVLEAAGAAGRPRPRLMAYVRCALLPQAEERLAQESGRYASYHKYAAHFERMGVSARNTCLSSDDPDALQAGIRAHEAVLDDAVVRAITADDGEASILELLRATAP